MGGGNLGAGQGRRIIAIIQVRCWFFFSRRFSPTARTVNGRIELSVIKRGYVRLMQRLGQTRAVSRFVGGAADADMYGWRRWFASLFAIYDTGRMVALDLPWWNVEATREVEQFLASHPGARVFEFGAGASTAWLAKRAGEVFSVEHDAVFIGRFRKMLTPFGNVELLERSIDKGPDAYVDAISEIGDTFDLIVVDGRHRSLCLEAAALHLSEDGMVLFDDSGRKRYRSAIERSELKETHYFGRSFCVPYPDHTSLLLRDG